MRARSKTERNALYIQALAFTVLATVKEALAVGVAADEAMVLVLGRTSPTGAPSATSGRELGAIYAARFPRTTLDSLSASDWAGVGPVAQLLTAPGAALVGKGVTMEVVTFSLTRTTRSTSCWPSSPPPNHRTDLRAVR